MANIEMYSKSWCGFCAQAKRLLQSKGVSWTEYDLDKEPARAAEMQQRTGGRTVPQIVIDGEALGGCSDLMALDASGALDKLLQL